MCRITAPADNGRDATVARQGKESDMRAVAHAPPFHRLCLYVMRYMAGKRNQHGSAYWYRSEGCIMMMMKGSC
jgi:hypothetical protein